MKIPLLPALLLALAATLNAAEKPLKPSATVESIFDATEILDEISLQTEIIQDWHPVGATRQKLIEINVAEIKPSKDGIDAMELAWFWEYLRQAFSLSK